MFNFKDKMPKVKFYGSFEQEKEIKNRQDNVVSRRLIGLLAFALIVCAIMVIRLGIIQLTQGEEYQVKLEKYGISTYTTDAPRGEITDRNYTKLVTNEMVVNATYYAPKSTSKEQIETTANFLATNVNLDTTSITLRNKKDYFINAFEEDADALVSDEERASLSELDNYESALYNLQLERITEEMINEKFDDFTMKFTHFKLAMQNCSSGSTVLAEGLTDQEASVIGANKSLLKGVEITNDWSRTYVNGANFKSVLGNVTTKREGLPAELKTELLAKSYQNNSRVGNRGIESQYEDILRGNDSTYTISYDSDGNPIINNTSTGVSGSNVRISIDWELQQYADELIEKELIAGNSKNRFFNKMYLTLMDPNTGEIIVMSSKSIDKETGEVSDNASGNYLEALEIGSTIKGGSIYTGFKEGLITPNTVFIDEPIKIAGTKEKKSVSNMGAITEVDALARSSNVYMFRIAMLLGQAEYTYNKPLVLENDKAFDTYRKDLGELGLGVKTGLDVPTESLGFYGTSRSSGNLLDAFIGQYDTYTMIQLTQYVSTLANQGVRVQPKFFLDSFDYDDEGNVVTTDSSDIGIMDDVSEQSTAFSQIKEGMRACVTRENGTCRAYWSTKPYVTYAKTGTAEVYQGTGNVDYPNHLQIGYISETEGSKPVLAFACASLRQTTGGTVSSSSSCPYISQLVVDKYVEKYGFN